MSDKKVPTGHQPTGRGEAKQNPCKRTLWEQSPEGVSGKGKSYIFAG